MGRFLKNLKRKIGLSKKQPRVRGYTNTKGGFTYVELIVVLSIFSVMSSVVLFNYGGFQEQIEIRTLANEIALRIVKAQKSAVSGQIPSRSFSSGWRPSYGIFFNLSTSGTSDADSKDFVFFTDLNSDKKYSDGTCSSSSGECLNRVSITNGRYISGLKIFYQGGSYTSINGDLSITFTRPNSEANFVSSSSTLDPGISYAEITIASTSGNYSSSIDIYASGRIQVN